MNTLNDISNIKDKYRYKTLYPRYNLPLPDDDLVNKGVFKCPLCGKERNPDNAFIDYIDGPVENRDWDIQGRLITVQKTIPRIPVRICSECHFKRIPNSKDDRYFTVSLILLIAIWIFLCIYLGIKDGSFIFVYDCLLRPFFLALGLYVVFALFHGLISLIKYPHLKTIESISMKEAAKNNAL